MDRSNLLKRIAERANLREGPQGVERVLRAIAEWAEHPQGQGGQDPAFDERALARIVRMPLPVVAAVLRELQADGFIEPGPPLRLSRAGAALIESAPDGRVKSVPTKEPARVESSKYALHTTQHSVPNNAQWQNALDALRRHMDRPSSPEQLMRRVAALHEQGALAGKDVLVMGDDLSPAVAVALLGKALSPNGRLARRVVALHYDERRLRHLRDIAQAEGVLIGLVTYKLQRTLPEDLQGEFSTVWVSPPTHDALPLYLSRAVEAAAPDGGRILLLLDSNFPDQQLEVQRAIADMGLLIQGLSIEPGDNHSFYSLAVTDETIPLIEGDYTSAP